MNILNFTKCKNLGQFTESLNTIENYVGNENCGKKITKKISEFLETNKEYLSNSSDNKGIAISLDSIGSKVKKIAAHDPLVGKLRDYTSKFLPSDKEHVNDSLNFLRTRSDMAWIADWVNLNEIPLAKLNLTLEELKSVLPKLEQIDFNGFNYDNYDLKKLAEILLKINLQSKISDEKILFELAKLCAQQDGMDTAENINQFGIEKQDALVEIAMLCAQQRGGGTAAYITNFGIEDKSALVEIAKLCAQKDGWATSWHIKKYGIEDQAALVEIAKLCAQQSGQGTARYIQNFGIKDQADLVEIAKLCAQQSGMDTAENINQFGIEKQDALVEIAKLCAQRKGDYTAYYIKNFGIEKQDALVEIAMLCAQQSPMGTTQYIKNFGIKNLATLAEIAKLCAQQNAWSTAKNIKNFGIKDQDVLVEIAKLCAQQSGMGTAGNINQFGIEKQDALVEIAKLCAQQDGRGTTENIKNFGIKDEAVLTEIAKLCAQQNFSYTACNIENFGIKDEAALIEIAKFCAQQNGMGTAENINKFGIEKQDALVEIAKLCAQQNGGGTAFYIKNFAIEDKATLIAIAKLCAQQDGAITTFQIKNFGIEDMVVLAEIAKLCAQQNGVGTAEYIKKFGIEDLQILYGLFIECVNQDTDAFFLLGNFSLLAGNMEKFSDLVHVLKSNDEEKDRRIQLFEAINELIEGLSCSEDHKEVIRESSGKIAQLAPHAQRTATLLLLQSLFLMDRTEPEAIDWMVENGLWSELGNLRQPNLRRNLTPGLFAIAGSRENRKEWDTIISLRMGRKGMRLMAIPLYGLQQQGVNQELLMEFAKNLSRLKKIRKDASKIQTLLHMTHLLSSTTILTPEQKSSGFAKIFSRIGKDHTHYEKHILQNATAAKGLLQLKETLWADSQESLSVLFRNCFEKLIPLRDFKGDASDKYDQIFARCRNPGGLLTYAAGLKTLNEPEVINCLGRYVVSVFNGTFKEMRYDTKNNPHLGKIFEVRPDLREKWKEDVNVSFEEISGKGQSKDEKFDARGWLRTKLMVDKHLGDEDLSYLRRYLEADSDKTRKSIARELSTELSTQSKEKKKQELEKDPVLQNLKLQNVCIKLANAGATETILTLEKNFREINQFLDVKNAASEFAHDLKGILETLEKSKDKITGKETLQVVISDDPIDLLLAGTDVAGSCQRLDGTPILNKGLLGYLMDGKNRLLAIKDSKGKIVVRCMLRLLWDGEQPVLYRERFYPDIIGSKEAEALNNIAIKLAKELAMPLTEGGEGIPYGKELQALGGPAPYEYSDGSGGVRKDGRYTISDAMLISS